MEKEIAIKNGEVNIFIMQDMFKSFIKYFHGLMRSFFTIVNSRQLINVFLALIILFGIYSCREECKYKPGALAGVSFYSVTDGTDHESALDSLTVRGLGREDSLLYAARNNITSVSLPLNGSADESGFIIDVDKGADTIWLSYKVIPWFLSQECGFILNFELLETKHTENLFDSVVIVNKAISTFDDTNIRIYH